VVAVEAGALQLTAPGKVLGLWGPPNLVRPGVAARSRFDIHHGNKTGNLAWR
jgi:hypothetical protein